MGDTKRVELGAVQETLLIPLYARAMETVRAQPLLADDRALELVRSIDDGVAKFGRGPSILGCVLRTAGFWRVGADVPAALPEGTVVEIRAGLDTRVERPDNGSAHQVLD